MSNNQTPQWIWLDGAWLPLEQANVSLLTQGLHYGTGCFEGERAYDGKIYALKAHNRRLFHSAKTLGLSIDFSPEELISVREELLLRNGLSNAYVRPLVYTGEGINMVYQRSHVAIMAVEWPGVYHRDVHLEISPYQRLSPKAAPLSAKANGYYLMGCMSKNQAMARGKDDALFLDDRGYVAECTGANIFFVQGRTLITPTTYSILNGITRQSVFHLAGAQGLEVVERDIEKEEFSSFDGAFACGTAVEISNIHSIDAHLFKENNAVIGGLQKAYQALVRSGDESFLP